VPITGVDDDDNGGGGDAGDDDDEILPTMVLVTIVLLLQVGSGAATHGGWWGGRVGGLRSGGDGGFAGTHVAVYVLGGVRTHRRALLLRSARRQGGRAQAQRRVMNCFENT
jgi:hypothetical protein